MSIAEQNQARAFQIAQLAVQLDVVLRDPDIQQSVKKAAQFLEAAEDHVAAERGEFRGTRQKQA